MNVKEFFSGNRNKAIIVAVAAVLVIGVAAGVIAHNAGSNKGAIAGSSSGSSQSSSSTPDDTSSRAAALISQFRSNVSSQEAADKAASSEAALASKSLHITVGGKSSSSSSSVAPSSPTGGKPAAASSSAAVPVSSVDFTQRSLTLTPGRTYQLTANITPGNASNHSLSWTSTNSGIVSVNQTGGITAKAPGTALIRAMANNGQRDTCTVTVRAAGSTGGGKSTGGSTGSSASSSTGGSSGKGISGVTLPSSPVALNKDIDRTFNGVDSYLNPGGGVLQLGVNTSSVNKTGSNLYLKIYENGALWKSAYWGLISPGDTSESLTVGLDKYVTNGYWWEKPASYRIECYKGSLSGTPFETISFSVNELGFT